MTTGKAIEAEQKDFFIELDRRDQQQIVMRAMGDIVEELFYEVHGRKALSWEGINTVAYLMGDIEVDDWVEWERVEMFGDRVYWSVTVRARNTRFGLSSLGMAEAPELMDVYDRDERNQRIPDPDRKGEFKTHLEPDEFCRRKALSKAQRNAKRAVMPTAVLKKWLQYFIDLKLFQKGTRLEKPGIPFKPKTVDAEYQVLGDPKPEKKSEAEHPEKPEKKTPEKKTKKKAIQLSLGKVNRDTVAFNLKAAGFEEEVVVVLEEGDDVLVEPTRELTEEEVYKISGALDDVGAVFEERGCYGQWKINKKS